MIGLVVIIYICCGAGLLWSLVNARAVTSIDLRTEHSENEVDMRHIDAMLNIGKKIENGASAFLSQEFTIMTIFVLLFSIVVYFMVDHIGSEDKGFRVYATVSYLVGSFTSMICGYIGMAIAVKANFRTTYKAISSLSDAFKTAFRAGCVMGFSMISLSLLILLTLFEVYKSSYKPVPDLKNPRNYAYLMEFLAAYGLGGSSIALFGRVGGGIYTKAADVGADLVGKVEEGLAEDSPKNPATIADNVGDNVGDIAGMGSDLFGSFAESTCAALVFVATNQDLINFNKGQALYFPMMISALGIIACILSSIYGIYFYHVRNFELIEKALKLQLMISTILILLTIPISAWLTLPQKWRMIYSAKPSEEEYTTNVYACISVCMGLISGLIIGYSTDFYTSNAHEPVKEMANSCSMGPAINIIYGLALGYNSTIIPVIFLALTAIVSIALCGLFGVALAAIGMLSNLCVGLAIDAYGPISDNAGGIAEMAELGEEVRNKTDALDAAGNTTAAIGKGFAIGSAALVSLALYGAFVTRSKEQANNPLTSIEVTQPYIFGSLLIGAMLPYAFSAMTMKSVGKAAKEMVVEVRRQFRNPQVRDGTIEPDYESCIRVSTKASLKEMIAPGLLVILTPIFFGVVFHPALVAGLLPGALLSGIQLAISMSNTGGAWDNAKKYIESGRLISEDGKVCSKGTEEHKAAVIGDTVGDPLKDTSGPSINILIKLMAIISLVFAGAFSHTALLARFLKIK
jgi:H(+)-translocating pyrophosphatase